MRPVARVLLSADHPNRACAARSSDARASVRFGDDLEVVPVEDLAGATGRYHLRRMAGFGEQPGEMARAGDMFQRFGAEPAHAGYLDPPAVAVARYAQVLVEPFVLRIDLLAQPRGQLGVVERLAVGADTPNGRRLRGASTMNRTYMRCEPSAARVEHARVGAVAEVG